MTRWLLLGLVVLALLIASLTPKQQRLAPTLAFAATPTPTASPSPLPTISPSNMSHITGQVVLPDGEVAASKQVYFHTVGIQNASGFIIPGGSSFSVFTDGSGNLPGNVYLVKKSIVEITIGSGQPVRVQTPTNDATLTALILANLDPPSVVSDMAISNGSDVSGTVVNPASGAIGTATLTLGPVIGIQGSSVCATVPTDTNLFEFNSAGGNWCPASTFGNLAGRTSGGPFTITNYNVTGRADPGAYGAKFDAKTVSDLVVTPGTPPTVTCADCAFTSSDVGKIFMFYDQYVPASLIGGRNVYTGTIASVGGPTTATLSGSYTGAALTNTGATWCSDDLTPIQNAVNSVTAGTAGGHSATVEFPNKPACLSNTLVINNRSMTLRGNGWGTVTPGDTPGSMLIWAGPSGVPIISVTGAYSPRIQDLTIEGNSNPANRPSALISANRTASSVTTKLVIDHVFGGATDFFSMPEGGGRAVGSIPMPTADNGVLAAATLANNEQGTVSNSTFSMISTCINLAQINALDWFAPNLTCINSGIAVNSQSGGNIEIATGEIANTAQVFAVGTNSNTTARHLGQETDTIPLGGGARNNLPTATAVITSGSQTVTDSALVFVAADVGREVFGPGIPSHTFISKVVNGTTITISQAATASTNPAFLALGGHATYATFKGTAGASGGRLLLDYAIIDVNRYLPVDQKIIYSDAANTGDWQLDFHNVNFAKNTVFSETQTYKIDLSFAQLLGTRYFRCKACSGLDTSNLTVNGSYSDGRAGVTLDLDLLPAGAMGQAPNGVTYVSSSTGVRSQKVYNLLTADQPTIDPNRNDMNFTPTITGGLNLAHLSSPTGVSSTVQNALTPACNQIVSSTPDGATYTFTATLDPVPTASKLSVYANTSGGVVRASDNGSGTLTGTGLSSGTIDNGTGALSVTYDSTHAPIANTNIIATYLSAGGTAYYYRLSAKDGSGQTLANGEFSVNCNATIGATNYVTFQFVPQRGMKQICVYRATSSGAEVMSGACHSVNAAGPFEDGINANSIKDTVAVPSGAPPSRDSTAAATFPGDMTVNGNVTFTGSVTAPVSNQYTVATLPSYLQVLKSSAAGGPPGGCWTLGEASGNFSDSCNSNTGTAVGGISYGVAPAIIDAADKAITLNGTTGAITVATDASLPSGDTLSVLFWFKRAATGTVQTIFGQKTNGLAIFFAANDTLSVQKQGLGSNIVNSSIGALTDTTSWYFAAYTKAGAVSHLYFGKAEAGATVADVTLAGTNATLGPADASEFWGEAFGGTAFWNGSLDELAVYKTALTSAQITAIFNEAVVKKYGFRAFATDVGCGEMYTTGGWKATDCGLRTVATLPDCTLVTGGWAMVTDNNAACGTTGFWVSPVAGATNVCRVTCDGSGAATGWKID